MTDDSFPTFAYDDDLIEASRGDGRSRVRVYRLMDTAVVLGSGSRPKCELNLDACREDNVPILRRRGGGCAVVLGPGGVIVSVVTTGIPFGHQRRYLEALTCWLIEGLTRIGIRDIGHAGICDLALGKRKVGGACFYRSRDLLYYSASLLIDPDVDKITRYLKHPPREPGYRAGRSHASFMGSLAAAALKESDVIDGGRSSGDVSGIDAEMVAARLRRTLQPPNLGRISESQCQQNRFLRR